MPSSGNKELQSSGSKGDFHIKPSIYALKENTQKKSKRPVSAYVTVGQRRPQAV